MNLFFIIVFWRNWLVSVVMVSPCFYLKDVLRAKVYGVHLPVTDRGSQMLLVTLRNRCGNCIRTLRLQSYCHNQQLLQMYETSTLECISGVKGPRERFMQIGAGHLHSLTLLTVFFLIVFSFILKIYNPRTRRAVLQLTGYFLITLF